SLHFAPATHPASDMGRNRFFRPMPNSYGWPGQSVAHGDACPGSAAATPLANDYVMPPSVLCRPFRRDAIGNESVGAGHSIEPCRARPSPLPGLIDQSPTYRVHVDIVNH